MLELKDFEAAADRLKNVIHNILRCPLPAPFLP